jgi:hypothetical protein
VSITRKSNEMIESIKGRLIRAVISDPWDFVSQNGSEYFGEIDEQITELLRIKLERAIKSNGYSTNQLYARFRHAGQGVQDLLAGGLVPCNFTNEVAEDLNDTSSKLVKLVGAVQLVA